MITDNTFFSGRNRAPVLAAALVICLGLTPNTLSGATNIMALPPQPVTHNREVLGADDAEFYRAIFAAQGKNNFIEADKLIVRLKDKCLLGHVLADRYERRTASLPELQSWLTAYSDLPQADDLYQQARKLPGSKKANLTRPLAAGMVSGHGYGYATASGFRNRERITVKLSAAARRAAGHIESALRQGNPNKAKTLLEADLQKIPLPRPELVALQARLASGFFYNGNMDEARHLTDVSYMQNDARALWINGLSNYKHGVAATAANSFIMLANRDNMPDSDHAAAAFWAYRALKRSGANDEANKWLKEAASEPRSFYGLLASNLIGKNADNAWSWTMPHYNQQSIDALAKLPAGGRALALVQIGQNDLAESELLRLNPQGHRDLQQAMVAVADKAHMASLALKLGGMATNDQGKPYDVALYPVPPWKPSGGFNVERALIYALMRHESHFDPMAVSSQGACGLMQLMPATAERMNSAETHHTHGEECPDEFFDPSTNISLGQRYLRQLADQPMIGDNLLLLLAAYNGGPARLSQRTDTNASADPLLFMESLPAQETHDYVQQVLIQYWTYRSRLHQPLQSLNQLARGEWPRYTLHDIAPTREAAADMSDEGFSVASNVTVH